MNYYNILNLKKEPFSNSPEPEFLFQLPQYTDCLQKLEMAVRLRRGINVVIGDIGTGKTTLCRKLIQTFSSTSSESIHIENHLLLDPAFESTAEFLQAFAVMLGIRDFDKGASERHLKEKIKDCLFDKGVDEKKIVVLIIDEGQKIPENCLEILREFLNYETNKFKLLQIIIFAQKEFQAILKKRANLFDRINLLYHLKPLNFMQMRAMINYRLKVAGDDREPPAFFSLAGFAAIYLATRGYPRKVVFLCHQIVLKMIVREKKKAGWFLVRNCLNEMKEPLLKRWRWAIVSFLIVLVSAVSISAIILQKQNAEAYKQTMSIGANDTAALPPESGQSVSSEIVPESNNIRENEDVKMPDSLGKVSMTKKRTIWWTLYNIYGETSGKIMEEVMAANPHIKNKNMIEEGTLINLPSIPADNKPLKKGDILVVLESGKDLEKMYNDFRNNPDERRLPPLAFFSAWNKKEGFQFAVIIDKRFNDIKTAEDAAGLLPPVIAAKAKILTQWDEDTIFFNRRAL